MNFFEAQLVSLPKKINWYPGHQASALKSVVEKHLKRSDVILQVCDARLPISSTVTQFEKELQAMTKKKRILIFNKSDLADQNAFNRTRDYYQMKKNIVTVFVRANNSTTSGVGHSTSASAKSVMPIIASALNMVNHQFKAIPTVLLICGIPNVGKSTIINTIRSKYLQQQQQLSYDSHDSSYINLKKGKVSVTGAKPGVTRTITDIVVSTDPHVVLVDTPGIMLPNIPDMRTGLNFAVTGALPDKIVDEILVAEYFIHLLCTKASVSSQELFRRAYNIPSSIVDLNENHELILHSVAKRLGAQKVAGEYDLNQAASHILRNYRRGAFGSFSLEDVNDLQ